MMWECDMLSQYNKATESWSKNDVENASSEVSLAAHPSMVNEVADHQPLVLFKK